MAPTKIILIQTAFLGDLLLSVPLLKNIRKSFPKAEITLVCRQGIGNLFTHLGLVERYFEIKKGNGASYREVKETLAAESFDYLLSPHESFTTARLVWGITADQKISFRQWWNFPFFSELVEKKKQLPEALRQLSLLQNHIPGLSENLQKYIQEKSQIVPDWASPIVTVAKGNMTLAKPSICLFPGSVWATKKWTEEGFIEVGKDFLAKGYHIYIMGGPGEEKIAENVKNGILGFSSQDSNINFADKVQSFAGKTSLLETLQIIEQSDLVVTNDSAGQHLAALVETPTVTIFGPTVLEFGYRAWNNKSIVVENKNLGCRPCGKHGHQICPIGTHECMKSIKGHQVTSAATRVLES